MTTVYHLLKGLLDPVVFVLVLIAVGCFIECRKTKKKSATILSVLSFFILYGASVSPVSNVLCYHLEKDYFIDTRANPCKLDIVVVFGGGAADNKYLKETMPSKQTASRVLYAVQVYRKSGADYLVCCGKGGGGRTEAEVMGINVERLGIPRDKIKLDPISRNTWEHAVELNKMFLDKDLKIGLVTSAYHMKRSEREFRKFFPNTIPLPSDYLYSSPPLSIFTFLPKSGSIYKSSIALREMIGLAWYEMRKV